MEQIQPWLTALSAFGSANTLLLTVLWLTGFIRLAKDVEREMKRQDEEMDEWRAAVTTNTATIANHTQAIQHLADQVQTLAAQVAALSTVVGTLSGRSGRQ